jgi:hypothetical protein
VIVLASATSTFLPHMRKDSLLHDVAWLLVHPAWGFGFFILVNRAVQAEQAWSSKWQRSETPRRLNLGKMGRQLVVATAFVGVSSYSLYLTHELVIMQSWWFVTDRLPPQLNMLLIVVPATIGFAWLFYLICERPYMRKTVGNRGRRTEVGSQGSDVGGQRSQKIEIIDSPLVYTTSDL